MGWFGTRFGVRMRGNTDADLMCSCVVMLLQATGLEGLTEQRCGGSLPFGWWGGGSMWSALVRSECCQEGSLPQCGSTASENARLATLVS